MAFFKTYREHRFNSKAEKTVTQATQIINEMREQGYVLTLRQLYYQFVQRGWIPNDEKQYKRLGRIITNAREGGVMDWTAIQDLHRGGIRPVTEEDPHEVVKDIEFRLRFDLWERQETYLEVWIEKQALQGVIAPPCRDLQLRYMACKGYLSASEAWRAGLRFADAKARGKIPIMIHLADHDPSGLDMTDDNALRLDLFAETGVEVRRIALNMDQIEEFDPPPNPAKESDSRHAAYVARFGDHSWELDSMTPAYLDQLIRDTVDEYRDPDLWNDALEEQNALRNSSGLSAVYENWPHIQHFLYERGMIKS